MPEHTPPAAKPLVGSAAREHLASLIERSESAAIDARAVSLSYGLDGPAERIAWALDFLADAKSETSKAS
jgi:hypothetical protein